MATVLLLEDDRLSQRLVAKVFSGAGHEVIIAETVREGVEQLRHQPLVDLVILDNQLGSEWGWMFLGEIRQRPLIGDVPVSVYTSTREREQVIRYAQLGVQSFNLKPFKAEVLLAELKKATASGRRDRMIEPPEAACARLKISISEYASLLNSAVTFLETDRQTVNRLMTSSSPTDQRLAEAFDRMGQRLPQLGVRVLDKLVPLARTDLLREDYAAAMDHLLAIDAVATTLRQRALDLLDIGNSVGGSARRPVVRAGTNYGAGATASGPGTGRPRRLGTVARQTVSAPLGVLGRHLGVFRGPSYFREGDLLARCRPTGVVQTWLELIGWFDGGHEIDLISTAVTLRDIPGFGPACERILRHIDALPKIDATVIDWKAVVERIGVAKAGVLIGVGRLARAPDPGLPGADALRERALMSVILGFELGRLLRLSNPLKLSAAGIALNLGWWTLLHAEPGLSAVALALVNEGGDTDEVFTALFGMSAGEVGRQVLVEARAQPLYPAAAAWIKPAEADTSHQISLGVVALLEELVEAALAHHDRTALDRLRDELLDASHPHWVFLRERGVDVPGDMPEFVELIISLTYTASWIAHEATT